MAIGRDETIVLAAAAVLRLLLFTLFPSLHDILMHRVEISTPIDSFKRLQEGLWLFNHDINPYDGGVYHQSPLFLPLFSLLPKHRVAPIWTDLLYILADLTSAWALTRIAKSGQASASRLFTSTRHGSRWTPSAVAAAFLFNPFTVATCLAQPTSVFTHCATLLAIAQAIDGDPFNSVFALACAAFFSMYPILLAPPLALLTYDRACALAPPAAPPPRAAVFFPGYAASLAAALGGLACVSYCVMGFSWDFVGSQYGPHLLLSDLTPNVGLWWYFFIEMFDSFREFFLAVFWLHMCSYMPGITIRMRNQPLFVLVTLLGLFAAFKPYPSIADASLYLGLLPLYRHIFPLFRYGFIAAAALLYATFLGPAFHYLWIYAGSGNANFFYAITLVWSLGLTILVGDSIWAALHDEAEAEQPELRGKVLKQI